MPWRGVATLRKLLLWGMVVVLAFCVVEVSGGALDVFNDLKNMLPDIRYGIFTQQPVNTSAANNSVARAANGK